MKKIIFILIFVGIFCCSYFFLSKSNEPIVVLKQNSNSPVEIAQPTVSKGVIIPPSEPDNPKLRNEVREASTNLTSLFLDRIKARNQLRSKQVSGSNHKIQSQQEMRVIKSQITQSLRTSTVARDEYVKVIRSEQDPIVKGELLQVIDKLEPLVREEVSLQLLASDSPDDRIVASETLSSIGTRNAVESLEQAATSDTDPGVRKSALEALARFQPKGVGEEWADSSSVIVTLKQFAQPQNDLKTRETAIRGLISQKALSAEDKIFISQFAKNETDPKLRQMVQSSANALANE